MQEAINKLNDYVVNMTEKKVVDGLEINDVDHNKAVIKAVLMKV